MWPFKSKHSKPIKSKYKKPREIYKVKFALPIRKWIICTSTRHVAFCNGPNDAYNKLAKLNSGEITEEELKKFFRNYTMEE